VAGEFPLLPGSESVAGFALGLDVPFIEPSRELRAGLEVAGVDCLPVLKDPARKALHEAAIIRVLTSDPLGEDPIKAGD
jgi:hypothetical protein